MELFYILTLTEKQKNTIRKVGLSVTYCKVYMKHSH
jgi:hypothetical protein